MDLPGPAYLFNLSLLAPTFATVSALAMLMRQTLGGALTGFDVYLMTGVHLPRLHSGTRRAAPAAFVPPVQGVGLFAAALTLSVGGTMWGFVRRISSLLGAQPGGDWDPRRG